MNSFQNTDKNDFEAGRLKALREYPELTNDVNDPVLDNIVSLAAKICEVPIAAISILDEQRQVFKASHGLDIRGTERSIAFCNYTILQDKIFEVYDARCDRRFNRNPLVDSTPHIRFYAGVPLVASSGEKLGALCIIDREPKVLSGLQRDLLMTLSNSVMEHVGHNRERNNLEKKMIEMDNFFYLSPDLLCEATMDGYFRRVSHSFILELGYTDTELMAIPFMELVHEEDKKKTEEVMKNLVANDKSVAFFHNRYRCKDGHYIKLSWNAIPYKPTKTIYATARNITEFERLKDELNQKKQHEIAQSREKFTALTNMTKVVSQRLLEPANFIIGFASVVEELHNEMNMTENLSERNEYSARILQDLKRIQKHGEYMSMVLNKMNSEAEWYQIPSVIKGTA
ncbi:MAG: PAS domain S-box protein [Sphingobacteriales bacterium]|jgi:PAS domain S-box-containing protein|nr:PAS domain S-box protein [Sphingobacteriales bacterium]